MTQNKIQPLRVQSDIAQYLLSAYQENIRLGKARWCPLGCQCPE